MSDTESQTQFENELQEYRTLQAENVALRTSYDRKCQDLEESRLNIEMYTERVNALQQAKETLLKK